MPATAIQPLPIALPGLRVLSWAAGLCIPIGISNDRLSFYGRPTGRFDANYDHLHKSTNDGASWSVLPQSFGDLIEGFIEKDDGEVVVTTFSGAGSPGYVWTSSGWPANNATATFTKRLTGIGGNFPSHWSAHSFSFGKNSVLAGSGAYGIVNEYGNQTSSSGDQTTKATRAFFTQDGGQNWPLVLDLQVRFPGVYPLHLHASAYDSYADRLWVTFGDTPAGGAGKQGLLFSDNRGGIWQDFPLPAEMGSDYLQSTGIAVLKDCIILTSDNVHGMLRIARTGYRQFGATQILSVKYGNSGSGLIGMGIHQNRTQVSAPVFAGFQSMDSSFDAGISVNLDGSGNTFTELWKDSTLNGFANNVLMVVGPSANGIILAATDVGGMRQLRGELVLPAANLYDGLSVFTGNGATTVFNVPHGLGVAPTQLQGWSTNALGGTFTLTATSTNLVFTFAVAPANAVNPAVAYRYGV